MKKIYDGGPAFGGGGAYTHDGMSMRDWFAGQALVGLAIAYKDTMYIDHIVADTAYRFADAMLAARNKETTN